MRLASQAKYNGCVIEHPLLRDSCLHAYYSAHGRRRRKKKKKKYGETTASLDKELFRLLFLRTLKNLEAKVKVDKLGGNVLGFQNSQKTLMLMRNWQISFESAYH